jgi:hypothetical protein
MPRLAGNIPPPITNFMRQYIWDQQNNFMIVVRSREDTDSQTIFKYSEYNNNNNNSIQFNSMIYYLCAESTAIKPIIDTAQCTLK